MDWLTERKTVCCSRPRRLEMTLQRRQETGRVWGSLCVSPSRTDRPRCLWCPQPPPSSSVPSRNPPGTGRRSRMVSQQVASHTAVKMAWF